LLKAKKGTAGRKREVKGSLRQRWSEVVTDVGGKYGKLGLVKLRKKISPHLILELY